VYLDTSYIAKFYFNEPESPRVRELVETADTIHSSLWALAEFHGVIHRRLREGSLSPNDAHELSSRFYGHVREGLWKLIPVQEALLRRTSALIVSAPRFVRLCYYVVVRTTLDISDEAYYIAKAIARDQNRSLGRVVGDLILQSSKGAKGASIKMSDYGFPTFRCARPVTTEDVKALDDEE
jgi:predicted nucleic acid-binding protein